MSRGRNAAPNRLAHINSETALRKASAGAVDFLHVAQVTNLARTLDELKRDNVWVVGIEEAPDARVYTRVDYTAPTAFVVGSELEGLRRLTRDKCDHIVKIPMWGQTPSLNVSVAGSIVLYEARMQRERREQRERRIRTFMNLPWSAQCRWIL